MIVKSVGKQVSVSLKCKCLFPRHHFTNANVAVSERQFSIKTENHLSRSVWKGGCRIAPDWHTHFHLTFTKISSRRKTHGSCISMARAGGITGGERARERERREEWKIAVLFSVCEGSLRGKIGFVSHKSQTRIAFSAKRVIAQSLLHTCLIHICTHQWLAVRVGRVCGAYHVII